MPYSKEIAELVGVKPLCSGRSTFAVWQKFHENNPESNAGEETKKCVGVVSEESSTELINSKCDVKIINSPILSMSDLKRESSSNANISSSDNIASSSQFSSQIIQSKDRTIVPDNSVNLNIQNIAFPEIQNKSDTQKVSSVSMNASNSSSCCGSSEKKAEHKGNDMNSLLKNFESLITKLEELISSRDSSKNFHVKEKQFSCCQHCHQNLHQAHFVKPCQFNKNVSTGCHSIFSDNDLNAAPHNCSINLTSNVNRTLPQEGPCIVIPLQNLSNESLIQVVSIISQNCSSVNNTSTLSSKKY